MDPKVSHEKGRANFLSPDEFAQLVRIAPLVAIDIIIRDKQGRVLLGRRNFDPAKGSYFVPGGRILKDEPIREAFSRILRQELGVVHEHFHPNSRYGPAGDTTHYVVLGYELTVNSGMLCFVLNDQHSALEWRTEDEILRMPEVHELTKAYFSKLG